MTDDEKREQVAKQCEAVGYMAKAITNIYSDYVNLLRAGGLDRPTASAGSFPRRTTVRAGVAAWRMTAG